MRAPASIRRMAELVGDLGRFLGRLAGRPDLPWACKRCDDRVVRRARRQVDGCVRCRFEFAADCRGLDGERFRINVRLYGRRAPTVLPVPAVPGLRSLEALPGDGAETLPRWRATSKLGRAPGPPVLRPFIFETWEDGGMRVARYREGRTVVPAAAIDDAALALAAENVARRAAWA